MYLYKLVVTGENKSVMLFFWFYFHLPFVISIWRCQLKFFPGTNNICVNLLENPAIYNPLLKVYFKSYCVFSLSICANTILLFVFIIIFLYSLYRLCLLMSLRKQFQFVLSPANLLHRIPSNLEIIVILCRINERY